MSKPQTLEIPKYDEIKNFLSMERKTLIKVNGFSDEEEFIRSEKDAQQILEMVQNIQVPMIELFRKYPSLQGLFNKDFMSFAEFISRDVILEICFLDEYLIPEKELFKLTSESSEIEDDVLKQINLGFQDWINEKTENHEKTQSFIKSEFDTKAKVKELSCQCITCVADFRNRLREQIYKDCVDLIDETYLEVEGIVEDGYLDAGRVIKSLQKDLDKKFFSVRFKLKRSSLNRLEGSIKEIVKKKFYYPSPLALRQSELIIPFFKNYLKDQGLRSDLVEEEQYERFFKQIASNIWRDEKYLTNEFKKLIKSVLALKRKDISANILKEYLGEFWIHSDARRINRKIVYHMGPTNSGKTHNAIEELAQAGSGCYLAPLRLLAGELYDKLNDKKVKTTLLTGEEVIFTEDATHYSSTIEMARFNEEFDCCVIDEIQMITDPQRGWAWTRALVNINAPVIHVCGDPSAYDLVANIADLCGDELEIKNYERMTELVVNKHPITVGDLKQSDALIVFSRRNALKYKSELERVGFKVSIVYGRLSPEVRREQARKFDSKETDIIVSTDAIAMGMNLPIQRIVFSTITKHINSVAYPISDSEIKQIAGRAGRYQRFPTGYVTCLKKVEDGIKKISKAINVELKQKEKCMVGPDLDIFSQVNSALKINSLPELKLSEFLRLFNTMTFKKPFYCVDLKEMIELAEMVEDADYLNALSTAETFGFACAPVNLGLLEHVQYYVWILNHYCRTQNIRNEPIDFESGDIDYLETSIKCVELYQWLSRHFNDKNFEYDEFELLENKGKAIERLNELLSDKIIRSCASCGIPLEDTNRFSICDDCYTKKRFRRGRPRPGGHKKSGKKKSQSSRGPRRGGKKSSRKKTSRNKSRFKK